MKIFSFIFIILIISVVSVNAEYIGNPKKDSKGNFKNVTLAYFNDIIEKKGFLGFILKYHNEKKTHTITVDLPSNSPPIISDYNSRYGVRGGTRSRLHTGVDFNVKAGEAILAANDGNIVSLNNSIAYICGGRILVIKHSNNLFSNYWHIGTIHVQLGDKVKRGQVIADAGKVVACNGGGLAHLHFEVSTKGPCKKCSNKQDIIIGRVENLVNPHRYWSGGKGKPECFDPTKKYRTNKLTLPVSCKN